MISKSGISGKEGHGEKAEVVRTCKEEERRARAKKMTDAPVPGKRQNQLERLVYMESVGVKVEDVIDRTKWKKEIQNYSGDPG